MKNGSAAVVFDAEKKTFLLVKRRDVPVWVLPGGGIDPGETPEEAAVREVREESGLEVRIVRKVAVYTPTGKLSSETHLFECAVVRGEPAASDETTDARFFPINSYPPPVFWVHARWLRDTCQNLPDVIVKPVEGLDWLALGRTIVRHPILAARYLLMRLGCAWNSK